MSLINFKKWIEDLSDLGYCSKYFQLNASDFGLPQNRPRLLMLSVCHGGDKELKKALKKYLNEINENTIREKYRNSEFFRQETVKNLLRTDYQTKKIREEAEECTPNDTPSRRKIWDDNPQIVLPDGRLNKDIQTIRTITTKQDRNPNSGNLYFDSGIPGRCRFRYLTPRECMLFMGFSDKDYENIKKRNVEFHKGSHLFSRDKIIRMSGNSIPVKLLEGMFYLMLNVDEFMRKQKNGCT